MTKMHVEIAGGGMAGLAVGTMLSRRGWSVRLHERDDAIREVGAGIFLRRNTLNVLEVLGAADDVKAAGMKLDRGVYRDGVTGDVIHDRAGGDGAPMWMAPRESVIQVLEAGARDAGVEIVTGSEVTGAGPDGTLTTSKGEFRADLIVGADGVSSAVRESLGLTKMTERLPSVVTRYLAPTREIAPETFTTMWWSGRRRVGIAPCGDNLTYIYMVCHESDERAVHLPIDVDTWVDSFPMLADKLPLLAGVPAIQNHFRIVSCHRWTAGRVALIGDAAHGLPPLLGQGAGLALSNANALANSVGATAEGIPQDLVRWERKFKHFSKKTQFWSMHLDRVTNRWPQVLEPVRRAYLSALDAKWIRHKMAIADRFPITPVGA